MADPPNVGYFSPNVCNKRSNEMFAMMEALEGRKLMTVIDDGLGGLGGLGGFDTIPPFPADVAPIYLGKWSAPRIRNISDSVNTTDNHVDVFRIKVEKRLKVTFDLKNLSKDADLVLYDGNGNVMASDGQYGTGDEHIGKNLGRGSYYACVYSYDGQTNYKLRVESRAAAPKKA
jgi:hypothetical protein